MSSTELQAAILKEAPWLVCVMDQVIVGRSRGGKGRGRHNRLVLEDVYGGLVAEEIEKLMHPLHVRTFRDEVFCVAGKGCIECLYIGQTESMIESRRRVLVKGSTCACFTLWASV